MTIKILTNAPKIAPSHPPLLFPRLSNHLEKRQQGFERLAQYHPMPDYCHFLAKLVGVQQQLLQDFPLENLAFLKQKDGLFPLDGKTWKRDPIWLFYLKRLLIEMKKDANPTLIATLDRLEKVKDDELNALADRLLCQEWQEVNAGDALFIWVALMLYWQQLASQLPPYAVLENGENLNHCPICHSPPCASVVHSGDKQGLRYLHCALCETEWNLVRTKCTQCDEMAEIAYFMLDEESGVRGETCDDCHGYLKIFFTEKIPDLDPMVADLASLELDFALGEKGYFKTGLNPYFFTA